MSQMGKYWFGYAACANGALSGENKAVELVQDTSSMRCREYAAMVDRADGIDVGFDDGTAAGRTTLDALGVEDEFMMCAIIHNGIKGRKVRKQCNCFSN